VHTLNDPWLQRWLPALATAANGGPVLEIGCGAGDDTVVLVRAGLSVVAFDRSPDAVATTIASAPAATVSVHDVRDPFPLERAGIGAVVASLSLHYFPWNQTVSIVERIRGTLRVGGLLLARFNATDDVNFGASGHPEIERGLYSVNGKPKRFFAEQDVLALFGSGWRHLSLQHRVSFKYHKPKALWEVLVERLDNT